MKNSFVLWIVLTIFLFSRIDIHAKQPVFDNCQEEFFDEFDYLIDDAIESGALKAEMEFKELTTTQRVLAKIGMPFLDFYTFVVLKYRALQHWVATKYGHSDASTESKM